MELLRDMIEFVADDVPDIDTVDVVVDETEIVSVSDTVLEVDPDFVAEPLDEGDFEMTEVFETEGLVVNDAAPVNVPVILSVREPVGDIDVELETVADRVDEAELVEIADPDLVSDGEPEGLGEIPGDFETVTEPELHDDTDAVGDRDTTKEVV